MFAELQDQSSLLTDADGDKPDTRFLFLGNRLLRFCLPMYVEWEISNLKQQVNQVVSMFFPFS